MYDKTTFIWGENMVTWTEVDDLVEDIEMAIYVWKERGFSSLEEFLSYLANCVKDLVIRIMKEGIEED